MSASTARITGGLYLGLAVASGAAFLGVRSRLYVEGDPAATLAALAGHPGLARTGVALELLVVAFQALAAVWFRRLFDHVDRFAAGAVAAFGLVNAVLILTDAAVLATAAEVARRPIGDAASLVQLLYLFGGHLWGVAALFFGLWLVPMGWCVLATRTMPRALGWVLMAGGAGYVLSAFVTYLLPDSGALANVLTLPPTVGELWMVGYLLVRGLGREPGTASLTPGAAIVDPVR